MKTTQLFSELTFSILASKLSSQIVRIKSSHQFLTDNNFKSTFIYETVYFTFDFSKKLITLKTISESGLSTHITTFKILEIYNEHNISGDTVNLLVSSTDFPLTTRIYYSDLLGSAICIDTAEYTITYMGISSMKRNLL